MENVMVISLAFGAFLYIASWGTYFIVDRFELILPSKRRDNILYTLLTIWWAASFFNGGMSAITAVLLFTDNKLLSFTLVPCAVYLFLTGVLVFALASKKRPGKNKDGSEFTDKLSAMFRRETA